MGQPYELWFDYNHTALKWHFPVGVLCDALVGVEVPVPLDLTVHFRGNSVMSDLLPFSGMADLQRSVMNAFKQAIFLEVGSASRFMRLEKKEHMMLWDAILQSDIKSFSQVEEKLMCSTLAECKSLAVRLHIWAPAHDDEVLLHKAPALRESGAAFTLADFLALAMPPLLSAAGDALAEGVEVLTQGLIVPLDTPLFWLALHASYLDHFVHLIARVPDSFLKA
ncbi:ATG5 [Symbiodinium sp. CCMP2592]|nr:ATG5 [Symbiodinium sp. CCMP2592]